MTHGCWPLFITLLLFIPATGSAQVVRPLAGHRAAVYAIAFHPDGRRLATASLDHTLKIWDADQGRTVRTFTGHDEKVVTLAFSADGKWLASAGLDRTVRLWNVTAGKAGPTFRTRQQCVHSLAFSPDDKVVYGAGESGLIEVWDHRAERRVRVLGPLPCPLYTVDVSADGRRLAAAGLNHKIYLVDAETANAARRLKDITKRSTAWPSRRTADSLPRRET